MSTTVKSLKISYNPINERNTFTNGDWISGQVTLEVAKDCQIDSLVIKFKGKAEVMWSERHHEHTFVYHAEDKYFKMKYYFIRNKNLGEFDSQNLLKNKNGERYSGVVAPGCHVYPFTFQIPLQDAPSSFSGSVGKIVYSLETKLSRSMKIDKKDSTKINFVSNPDLNTVPGLMYLQEDGLRNVLKFSSKPYLFKRLQFKNAPQHESKDKKMKFLSSGNIAMDVNIEKTGFSQGEGIKILTCIENNSSREIKPKYCVYRKNSFFAKGKRRVDTKDLLKEVGKPIPPSSNEKVTQIITVPHDVEPSILNCNIIKAEYRLKVYLDVKYASDPEIKLPIVLLPATRFLAVAPPPAAAAGFGFEPYGNPNPPAWGVAPPQPPAALQPFDPPPAYGAHGMYPRLTDPANKYQ